jgi:anti-anti-sigma regulatory factor
LRITIDDGPKKLMLKLEGRVSGPWARELRESWNSLSSAKGKNVVVDLCDVTHVDSAGAEVLADIHKQTGARFLADTPMTEYFADQACRLGGGQTKGKRGG